MTRSRTTEDAAWDISIYTILQNMSGELEIQDYTTTKVGKVCSMLCPIHFYRQENNLYVRPWLAKERDKHRLFREKDFGKVLFCFLQENEWRSRWKGADLVFRFFLLFDRILASHHK